MTKKTYQDTVNELRTKYDKERRNLDIKYALNNSEYSIGDILTDHMGSIKVDLIQTVLAHDNELPQCVYNGIVLNEDESYNVRGLRRGVWIQNIIKN